MIVVAPLKIDNPNHILKAIQAMRFPFSYLLFLVLLSLAPQNYAQGLPSATGDIEFCGYNDAPDTPSFVAEYNRIEKQRIALGYIMVCKRLLQEHDLQTRVKPWKELLPTLGFMPVDLKGTPFAQLELLGGVMNATIPSFTDLPRPDHVARVFRSRDGLTVTLEEWDLSILGGGTSTVYRTHDVMVNGWPGYWSIEQVKSGSAYSTLWWKGETREFKLSTSANLKLTGEQGTFLRLAESIQPGIPSGKKKPPITTIGMPGKFSKMPFPEKPPEGDWPKPDF